MDNPQLDQVRNALISAHKVWAEDNLCLDGESRKKEQELGPKRQVIGGSCTIEELMGEGFSADEATSLLNMLRKIHAAGVEEFAHHVTPDGEVHIGLWDHVKKHKDSGWQFGLDF
jgi:hypothetical protein